MKRTMVKKVTGIIANVLLYVFLALCIFSVVITVFSKKDVDGAAEIFGYQMRVVTSDSMAECELTDVSKYDVKSIPIRSMIFVECVPEEGAAAEEWYSGLKVGDVLTFRYVYTSQVTITHRITYIEEKTTGGYVINLAGDNKSSETGQLVQTIDTSIADSPNYVVGKVTGQSYLIGLLASLLDEPIGMILIVILPCFIIILLEVLKIVGIYSDEKKKREQEQTAKRDSELQELRRRLAELESGKAAEAVAEKPCASTDTSPNTEARTARSDDEDGDSSVKAVNAARWRAEAQERIASGLSVVEWCKKEGISKATYYYRMKRVKEHDSEALE